MVLLTMTPAMVAALSKYRDLPHDGLSADTSCWDFELTEPAVGKPISHAHVIDMSRFLNEKRGDPSSAENEAHFQYHLDHLLRGSKVYAPPAKPRPKPVSSPFLRCNVRDSAADMVLM